MLDCEHCTACNAELEESQIGLCDECQDRKYVCPECGKDNLEVVVEVWAKLIQTDDGFETDTSEPDDGSHNWNGNSHMRCRDCSHSAIAEEFEV